MLLISSNCLQADWMADKTTELSGTSNAIPNPFSIGLSSYESPQVQKPCLNYSFINLTSWNHISVDQYFHIRRNRDDPGKRLIFS